MRAYGAHASPNAQINRGDGNLDPKLQGPQGLQQRIEKELYAASQEDFKHVVAEMSQRDFSLKHIQVADHGQETFCIVRNWMEVDKIHMLVARGDERLSGDGCDTAFVDRIVKAQISDLAMKLAHRAKEGLSSGETANLRIDDLKVTISINNFWALCLSLLQRKLQVVCGVHLHLPFESLALDSVEMTGEAKKTKTSEKDLQKNSLFLSDKREFTDMEAPDEIKLNRNCSHQRSNMYPISPQTAHALRWHSAREPYHQCSSVGGKILASMDNHAADMQVH